MQKGGKLVVKSAVVVLLGSYALYKIKTKKRAKEERKYIKLDSETKERKYIKLK